MHIGKLFPSKYISAADLDGQDETTITMLSLQIERIPAPDGSSEEKPVLRFEGTDKGLVLNRTNADTIATLYGPETDQWPGQPIALFVARGVQAFGKTWDVVRVRSQVPSQVNGNSTGNGGLTADDLPF